MNQINLCDFGCGRIAIKHFKSGNRCCSKSTSSCPAQKLKNNRSKAFDIDWSDIQKVYDDGLTLGELSKKFHVSRGVINSAINNKMLIPRSLRESIINSRKRGRGKLSLEAKIKVSQNARNRIVNRYANGWLPKAGRCKKYKYFSPVAGEVLLDGTWELAVAKLFDLRNYNWRRNTKRFPYLNLQNKISYYTPDFWVENFNSYLEVKGYTTDLDRCKWSQFTENLIVWTRSELIKEGCLSG